MWSLKKSGIYDKSGAFNILKKQNSGKLILGDMLIFSFILNCLLSSAHCWRLTIALINRVFAYSWVNNQKILGNMLPISHLQSNTTFTVYMKGVTNDYETDEHVTTFKTAPQPPSAQISEVRTSSFKIEWKSFMI